MICKLKTKIVTALIGALAIGSLWENREWFKKKEPLVGQVEPVAAQQVAVPASKKRIKKPVSKPSSYTFKRWAILPSADIKESGISDLLSASLSQSGYELVEREQINAITSEQQLQAFSDGGIASRIKLGSILRADALIFVSMSKVEGKKVISVIIGDTHVGARLLVTSFPSDKPELLAGSLAKSINETRDRFAGGVKSVIAVPPFLNSDLTHDFDYLRASFKSLVESSLSTVPGVAVMETDEADAYRRELDLTGNQSNRLVPLFISGSFETRRTSPTTSPTGEWLVEVSLKVETRDGARVLNTFERKSLSLTKAAQAISWELPQSIMQNNLIELQPLDEDQQFAMLNNRADAFARIGAWEQCLALREAAVLVDPDDLALRRQIIKQSVKWLEQVATPIELRAGEARNAAQASGLPADYGDLNSALADVMKSSLAKFHPQWIRCQEHMQFLVYRVRDKDPMLHNLASSVQSISWRLINMSPRQNDRDQIKKEQSDLNRKVNREWGPVMAGSNPAKLREYVAQDIIPNMASPESIPKLRQLIEEIDDNKMVLWLPVCRYLAKIEKVDDLNLFLHPTAELDYPALVQILKRSKRPSMKLMGKLAELWIDRRFEGFEYPSAELRNRAEKLDLEFADTLDLKMDGFDDLLRQINQTNARMNLTELRHFSGPARSVITTTTGVPARPGNSDQSRIEYTPVKLVTRSANQQNQPIQDWCVQDGSLAFLPCGNSKVDVCWVAKGVFLLREKGFLDPIVTDPEEKNRSVVWDGQYVWAGSGRQGIHIIDTDGKIIAHIDGKQSLPLADQKLFLHALAPGKIFACGSFGDDYRGWCAIIERNEQGQVNVYIILRATSNFDFESPEAKAMGQMKYRMAKAASPELVFKPYWISYAPPGPDSPKGTIWIRRDTKIYPTNNGRDHLLKVDLDSLKVSTVAFDWIYKLSPMTPPVFLDSDRAVDFMDRSLFEVSFGKVFSSGKPFRFIVNEDPICLMKIEGQTYVVGGTWFNLEMKTLVPVRFGSARTPFTIGTGGLFCRSNVYGQLGWDDHGYSVCKITVDPSRPNIPNLEGVKRLVVNTGTNIINFADGFISIVSPKQREFTSGEGALVVTDDNEGRHTFKYYSINETSDPNAALNSMLLRTIQYPEEIQRVGLSEDQIAKLKSYLAVLSADKLSSINPIPKATVGNISKTDPDFGQFYEDYLKATDRDKPRAASSIFNAINDKREAQKQQSAESWDSIRKLITPSQMKAVQFEAPE